MLSWMTKKWYFSKSDKDPRGNCRNVHSHILIGKLSLQDVVQVDTTSQVTLNLFGGGIKPRAMQFSIT